MKYILVLCVLLLWGLLLQVKASSLTSTCDSAHALHLLAIVSHHYGPGSEGSIPKWKRGLEILPAAHIAAAEINNATGMLPGYCLDVIDVVTEDCNHNLALLEFTKLITRRDLNIVGITGLFCSKVTEAISNIAGRPEINLLQISGSRSFQHHQMYPYLYHMLPSSNVLTEALSGLMVQLSWSRIGFIVSANPDRHYRTTTEALANIIGASHIRFYAEFDLANTPIDFLLKKLQYSGVKITFVLLPALQASELICAAYLQGLSWPEYAWIFSDIMSVEELFLSTQCDAQSTVKAIEQIFLIHNQLEPNSLDFELVSGSTYGEYRSEYLSKLALHSIPSLHNLYSNVLHDSVWSFALALNSSLDVLHLMNLSLKDYRPKNFRPTDKRIADVIEKQLLKVNFSGAIGTVKFDGAYDVKVAVDIFQIRNATSIHIGYYNPVNGEFELDSLDGVPDDDLQRIYQIYPLPVSLILLTAVVFCTGLTTVTLVLFIYYRNEPEIKACSCHLSLCMFLGCYSLLIGALVHNLSSGLVLRGAARKVTCITEIGPCSIGLNFVLATLFVKMLRIYRVFTYFGRTGRACSDRVLAFIIFVIISGNALILIVWSAIDIYCLEDVETYQKEGLPPYYEVAQYCRSRYLEFWLAATLGYSGIVFIFVLILAFKTRKIQRKDFKDTKKVNALILSLVIVICLTVPLWWVLRVVGDSITSKAIVGASYAITALLCQLLLLVPKITPPLKRHIWKVCQCSFIAV